MTETARRNIMERLRQAVASPGTDQAPALPSPPARTGAEQRVDRLKRLMEAVRTDIYITGEVAWPALLKKIVRKKNIGSLLYAPQTDIGRVISNSWQADPEPLPKLRAYDRPIEAFKKELFGIDAAVTATEGAIAETGALILRPTPEEPRLMSLVPPVHIAVLPAGRIYDTFAEAVEGQNWAACMPTNALLISGPSKTADIEMTLAFGVHGPKELVVIVVEE